MLRAYDISPGCGGLSLGFRSSELYEVSSSLFKLIDLVGTPENDSDCTYALNFSDSLPGDDPDILIGSYPNWTPDDLTTVANWVRLTDPKLFLLELPRHVMWDPHKDTARFKQYGIELFTIDAHDYHVPQHRVRDWLLGKRIDVEHRYVGTPGKRGWPYNLMEVLGDVPLTPPNTAWPKDELIHSGLELHVGKRFNAVSAQRFDYVHPGGSAADVPYVLRPPRWQKKDIGVTEAFGRLEWEGAASEILPELNPEKGRFLHPEWRAEGSGYNQNRVLTLLESARIQTFPDYYKWYGTKVSVAKQIGTATPPKLAKYWAKHLAEILTNTVN